VDDAILAQLSNSELMRMRNAAPDAATQARLAPYEHRAFAREVAQDTPVQAVGLLAAIPAYQVAKATGLMKSRTGATQPWEQILEGYKGLGEGWAAAAKTGFGALLKKPAAPAVPALGAIKQPGLIPGVEGAAVANPNPSTIYQGTGVRG
jgi:hypothetical protein